MGEGLRCAKCSAALADGDAVRLWDGRDYCRGCVEAACPGMADYAAGHPALEETLRADLRRFLFFGLRWFAITCVGLVFFLPLVTSALRLSSWRGWVAAGLVVSGVVLVIEMFALALSWWGWRNGVRSISAEGGRLRVTTGGQFIVARRFSFTVPLAECLWLTGRTADAVELKDFVRDTEAVIVTVPARLWGFRIGPVTTACGLTPGTRAIWEGFLALAGVPGGRRRGFFTRFLGLARIPQNGSQGAQPSP